MILLYGDLAGESTYVPYGGERIAGSSNYGDINTSRAMVRGIAESPIGGLGEAAALQRRGIAGLEGLANYNTAAFNPYMGFQAGSADPYSGFQAGSADPFSGFQRQRGTEYTGFQAGAADPYSGFKLVVLIHSLIFQREEVESIQVLQQERLMPMEVFKLAGLIHLVILGKLNLQRRLRINTISIQPVSSVGQKYSSTWTHTCRMLWMFKSVKPVRTLAGAKQQEMQGQ